MTHPDRTKAPATHPFADIHITPEEVIQLANGTELHIVNSGELPVSRVGIYWEGGKLESTDRAALRVGVGAMREATASYSPEQLADAIDFNGARISSRCADHYCCLDLLTLNSHLDELMPLIGSIATEASFPGQTVGMTARKEAANLAVKLSRVAYRAGRRLRNMMYGYNHPGFAKMTPEDYEGVTPERCRAAYGNMLRAHKVAFLGGAFDSATVDKVCLFLESLPSSGLHPLKVVKFTPEPVERVFIPMPEAKQAAVAMALPTIGRDHPDYITLRLAVMALGGYFGSRLMGNIREEKGLTYGISSGLLGSREGAYMEINAQTDSSTVDQVIEESCKEIASLAANPPRGEELLRLQQYAWSQLAASADSSLGILDTYITRLLVATPPDYFQAQLRTIESLTPEAIARVASLYLDPAQLRIVVAGRE